MVASETEVFVIGPDGAELLHTVLPPGEYVIGRTAECHLRVNADLVSRKHARLIIADDSVLIEDLGSSNGTYVNGEQVTDSVRLAPDQSVQVGAATISVRRKPAADGSESPPNEVAVRRLLPEELLQNRKYVVGREVAKGGMGSILSAEESAIRREVAMKVIRRPGESDLLRFVEEAQITGQLEHPNIVPVHELGVDENDRLFYTMKMVRGITLKKVLELLAQGVAATSQKYPLPVLLTIFQKVCDGIAFAHAKGVIHRDLKPENFMLGGYGEVLVMDWGLAKVINSRAKGDATMTAVKSGVRSARDDGNIEATMEGTIMGTPQYMSPEQARGEVETLDERSDIYSLGAILYQILCLRPHVAGKKAMEIVEKVARGETLPLSPKFPHRPIPDSLAAVVHKAMAFDAAHRYASVHELQEDIAAYQGGYATSAEHATAWKQFHLLVARNRKVALTAAAALALVVLVSAGFTLRVISARNQAEAQQKRAVLGEKRAEQTLATANRTLLRLKFEKARSAFDEGRGDEGLAWLAAVLRQDSENRVAATWLLSALSDRNFPVPSGPRIVIPKVNQGTYEGTTALRFSPDGKSLLIGTRTGGLNLWNCEDGRPLAPARTMGDIRQAWWLPGAKAYVDAHYGAREAYVWNAETGQNSAKTVPSEGQLTWLIPSADGRLLATADDKFNVGVWDLATMALQGEMLKMTSEITALDFSKDDRWLAVRTNTPNETRVFDWRTGRPAGTPVADTNGWQRFHPFASRLLIPKAAQNRWQIRDIADGRVVESKEGHSTGSIEAAFSPEGSLVATGADDFRARVWDARTGLPVTPWLRHAGRVMRPEFSPEGLRLLTFGTDYVCRLWNVLSGELIAEPWQLPEGQYDPNQCRFSPDGAHVALATRNRQVQLYDVREGRQLPFIVREAGGISSMTVSPDGKRCAVIFNTSSPHVRFFDATTGEKIGTDLTHGKSVNVLAFSPDGRWIATGSNDMTAMVWDSETGQPVGKPLPHEDFVNALGFSPDGKLLATAGVTKDRKLHLWDAATGQPAGEPWKLNSNVTRLAFSPDQTLLAIATDSGALLYEVRSGQKRGEFAKSQSDKDVRFSRDGSLVAFATEREGVLVIRAATGKEAYPPLPHENAVIAVRFSPDGSRLLTASLDGFARVWNAKTGEPVTGAFRHGDVLTTAEFSPDGVTVATAARDGTVRLWDAETGDPMSEPLRHSGEVRSIAFAADGRRLITALAGDWVHFWDVPPALGAAPSWLPTLAEAVAGRRISPQGEIGTIGAGEFWSLREQLRNRAGSEDPFDRWVAWFLDDRGTRLASAWSGRSLPAVLDKLRTYDTQSNYDRLLRYLPDDPATLGHAARGLVYQAKTVATAGRDSEYLASIGGQAFLDALLAAQRKAGTAAYTSGAGARGFPARDAAATARELDLTWHYNMILDAPWVSDDSGFKFSALPKGVSTIDNIRWDIRGALYAASLKQPSNKPMASRVEGVPILQKAKRIHMLQTCAWNSPTGTKIATYVLHYVDGDSRELPIVYGEDLRDWSDSSDPGAVANARAAWKSAAGGKPVHLYHRVYDNPRPEVEIASLDLAGAGADAAAIVVAITVE